MSRRRWNDRDSSDEEDDRGRRLIDELAPLQPTDRSAEPPAKKARRDEDGDGDTQGQEVAQYEEHEEPAHADDGGDRAEPAAAATSVDDAAAPVERRGGPKKKNAKKQNRWSPRPQGRAPERRMSPRRRSRSPRQPDARARSPPHKRDAQRRNGRGGAPLSRGRSPRGRSPRRSSPGRPSSRSPRRGRSPRDVAPPVARRAASPPPPRRASPPPQLPPQRRPSPQADRRGPPVDQQRRAASPPVQLRWQPPPHQPPPRRRSPSPARRGGSPPRRRSPSPRGGRRAASPPRGPPPPLYRGNSPSRRAPSPSRHLPPPPPPPPHQHQPQHQQQHQQQRSDDLWQQERDREAFNNGLPLPSLDLRREHEERGRYRDDRYRDAPQARAFTDRRDSRDEFRPHWEPPPAEPHFDRFASPVGGYGGPRAPERERGDRGPQKQRNEQRPLHTDRPERGDRQERMGRSEREDRPQRRPDEDRSGPRDREPPRRDTRPRDEPVRSERREERTDRNDAPRERHPPAREEEQSARRVSVTDREAPATTRTDNLGRKIRVEPASTTTPTPTATSRDIRITPQSSAREVIVVEQSPPPTVVTTAPAARDDQSRRRSESPNEAQARPSERPRHRSRSRERDDRRNDPEYAQYRKLLGFYEAGTLFDWKRKKFDQLRAKFDPKYALSHTVKDQRPEEKRREEKPRERPARDDNDDEILIDRPLNDTSYSVEDDGDVDEAEYSGSDVQPDETTAGGSISDLRVKLNMRKLRKEVAEAGDLREVLRRRREAKKAAEPPTPAPTGPERVLGVTVNMEGNKRRQSVVVKDELLSPQVLASAKKKLSLAERFKQQGVAAALPTDKVSITIANANFSTAEGGAATTSTSTPAVARPAAVTQTPVSRHSPHFEIPSPPTPPEKTPAAHVAPTAAVSAPVATPAVAPPKAIVTPPVSKPAPARTPIEVERTKPFVLTPITPPAAPAGTTTPVVAAPAVPAPSPVATTTTPTATPPAKKTPASKPPAKKAAASKPVALIDLPLGEFPFITTEEQLKIFCRRHNLGNPANRLNFNKLITDDMIDSRHWHPREMLLSLGCEARGQNSMDIYFPFDLFPRKKFKPPQPAPALEPEAPEVPPPAPPPQAATLTPPLKKSNVRAISPPRADAPSALGRTPKVVKLAPSASTTAAPAAAAGTGSPTVAKIAVLAPPAAATTSAVPASGVIKIPGAKPMPQRVELKSAAPPARSTIQLPVSSKAAATASATESSTATAMSIEQPSPAASAPPARALVNPPAEPRAAPAPVQAASPVVASTTDRPPPASTRPPAPSPAAESRLPPPPAPPVVAAPRKQPGVYLPNPAATTSTASVDERVQSLARSFEPQMPEPMEITTTATTTTTRNRSPPVRAPRSPAGSVSPVHKSQSEDIGSTEPVNADEVGFREDLKDAVKKRLSKYYKAGRITSKSDFSHLCKKMIETLWKKEKKRTSFTESTERKVNKFLDTYMEKHPTYVRKGN